MQKILLASAATAAAAFNYNHNSTLEWPNKNHIHIEGNLITKTFGGEGIPELSRQGAFDLELKILQLLEANREMCDSGRRHFPLPTSWVREKKQLTMTYEGKQLEEPPAGSSFHDHSQICIAKEAVTKENWDAQWKCMLEIMEASEVRHLDMYCPPGCNTNGQFWNCGSKFFLKNLVFKPDGRVSMIDFEFGSIKNKPFENKMCYKRNGHTSSKEYYKTLAHHFEKQGWPRYQQYSCDEKQRKQGYKMAAEYERKHSHFLGKMRAAALIEE